MKKTKSFIAFVAFALTFACVLSCDNQDEELKSSVNAISDKNSSSRIVNPNFNGTEGDPLDLATAKKWAANYRSAQPGETLSHFFGFEIIQQILSESSCVGIRIYYALDEDGNKKLLIVGVDAAGQDLLPAEGGKISDDGNTIADYSFPCPYYCGSGL